MTKTSKQTSWTVKEAQEVIGQFDSNKAKMFWIKALVKQGKVNQGQAGVLVLNNGLI